ncbi:MAG TPA: FkbM family methyltransferase [Solirubrobacteraceae bacterium]|jgi:FkbM family methyltransferase
MASINPIAVLRVDLGLLRRHLRGLYWLLRSRNEVLVGSVRIRLEEEWATRVVRRMIYMDRYELDERHVLAATLRPTDRYLEVGAGLGVLATWACGVVGDGAVYAYEANPKLISVIADTAHRNGVAPDITHAVLGDRTGTAEFHICRSEFWSSRLRRDHADVDTVSVPIIEFATELERSRATYLMVDIEGGEIQLLAEEPVPATVRAICVETHPEITGPRETQRMLRKLMDEGFVLRLRDCRHDVAYLDRF